MFQAYIESLEISYRFLIFSDALVSSGFGNFMFCGFPASSLYYNFDLFLRLSLYCVVLASDFTTALSSDSVFDPVVLFVPASVPVAASFYYYLLLLLFHAFVSFSFDISM